MMTEVMQWLKTINMEMWAAFATAFATFLLFFATILLVVATNSLKRVAADERDTHKAIATAEGWDNLRAELKEEKDKRTSLGKLERFATLVNRGVYDLDFFVLMSGSWFLASGYHATLAERQQKAKEANKKIPYTQIKKLRQSVQKRLSELNLEDI
jgi:hypothetical protein